MAYKDLQDFMHLLKEKKLLDEIQIEVDRGLEIILPLVITVDPETNQQNVGMYRL
ncbi:hypothetical protein [Clostridium sp.]|uniref:hypothetical protein n=1 Tax=Clostridium sp. TaxID=1506 RepID=UPI003D6C97FE